MELYLIRFALIGLLLAVSAVILVKGVLSSDGEAMVSAGYFLWFWMVGGILLMLLYVAVHLIL